MKEKDQEKQVRVCLVEDEAPAAKLLKKMLLQLRPNWKVDHIASSNEEAEEWFKLNPDGADILFSDIELSDGLSFGFIDKVKPKCMLVFVTAYDEYAVRAFSVNSIDYLLKPINKDRLLAAIEKYEKFSASYFEALYKNNIWSDFASNEAGGGKKYRSRFLIERGNQMHTINVEDVAYFYSESKICYAQTVNDGSFILETSLDKLSEELDPDLFFRASRQILLSAKAISKIENYFNGRLSVSLKPEYPQMVLVSKEKAEMFRNWLNF